MKSVLYVDRCGLCLVRGRSVCGVCVCIYTLCDAFVKCLLYVENLPVVNGVYVPGVCEDRHVHTRRYVLAGRALSSRLCSSEEEHRPPVTCPRAFIW